MATLVRQAGSLVRPATRASRRLCKAQFGGLNSVGRGFPLTASVAIYGKQLTEPTQGQGPFRSVETVAVEAAEVAQADLIASGAVTVKRYFHYP